MNVLSLFPSVQNRIRTNSTLDAGTGCWMWSSKVGRDGYGLIELRGPAGGRSSRHWRVAHRVAFEAFVGLVPSGLELDHTCRVRSCVNPDHLEPVTHAENVRRAKPYGLTASCRRGHSFTLENTRTSGARRVCRQCEAIRSADYRARRRA
jgi:hypothetical protein